MDDQEEAGGSHWGPKKGQEATYIYIALKEGLNHRKN